MSTSLIRVSPSWRTAFAATTALLLAGGVPESAFSESLPAMRPALVGSGPQALINLIDTQALLKKGQKDAILLFNCTVQPSGQALYRQVYRVSEGGDALKDEVKIKLYRARFVPAVYNHHNTYSAFYGTVIFWIDNGKPRLRIFANQETTELERGSDFIAPQSIYIPNHFYEPIKYPAGSWSTEDRPAVVDISLTVDSSGKMTDVRVVKEFPPGKGFGENALKKMKTLTYLPGYRNGKPVTCTVQISFPFFPGGWIWKP